MPDLYRLLPMDIIYYLFGPRLYMDYNANCEEMYSLAVLEQIGDYLINTTLLLLKLSLYMSPIIGLVCYHRDLAMNDVFHTCLKIFAVVCFILVIAMTFRGIGRYQSESYRNLISALKKSKASLITEGNVNALEMFDFDFRWWPVTFDVRSIHTACCSAVPHLNECDINSFLDAIQYILGYIFAHTVGVHLLYPGTISLLQSYLRPNLVGGRAELILKRNAHRFKIKTQDRNEIDTIFIDNRERSRNGDTLIINSEGNMSFYAIGVSNTNLARRYSILGWNHPGFEGSTGCPFPKQEFYAIDAVIKFAIYKLHFAETDIMLYGWSIGGYSAVCGASKFSNIKGLILDGTFDDVVYLVKDVTPHIFQNFVTFSIRCHCNLHNSELLKRYSGPVLIVRRIYDETMSSDNRLYANRTNNLIVKLLIHRYPNIFRNPQAEYIRRTLTKPLKQNALRPDQVSLCWIGLLNYVAIEGKNFPMSIGENYTEEMRYQMADFLLRKYCRDFHSSHCPPLEPEFFQIPWNGYTRESK